MLEKQYKRKKGVPLHPAVIWSRMKYRWPFLVWLAVAAIAVHLYLHGGRTGRLTGIVEVDRDRIAPLEAARIKTIHVQPGDMVKAGDLLIEMDTSILDAELAVERLQLERQFGRFIQDIENEIRDVKIDQAEAEAEYAVLDEEVGRLNDLLQRRLVDAQTVARLRARREALGRAVELYPETVQQLEEDLKEARQQKAGLDLWTGSREESPPDDLVVEASEGGTAPAERIGLMQLRKNSYSLKARRDGMVSRVYHGTGEVIPAGEPLLDVVIKEGTRVLGFLPEDLAREVSIGTKALLYRPRGSGPVIPATVVSISPEVLGLPARISPIRGQTLRGLRVTLVPDIEVELLPGEAVSISIER